MPPTDPSFLEWIYHQLGIKYSFLLLFVTVVACYVLRPTAWKHRSLKNATALLILVGPLPLYLGILATMVAYSTINYILANSAREATAEETRQLTVAAWCSTWVGAALSVPPIVLGIGNLARIAFRANSSSVMTNPP